MFIKVQDLPPYGTPAWFQAVQNILHRRDPVYNELNIFGQVLTQDVWKDKYRNGDEQTPLDTFARVADGIYEKDSSEHRQLAALAMMQGLWMPGGRILAGAGTGKRVTLMNCFDGDTIIPTKEYGNISLQDAYKKGTVTLLTRKGWVKSTVNYFGIQQVNKVTLRPGRSKHRRKTVFVTADHRWITSHGETTQLSVGQKVISGSLQINKQSEFYEQGLIHGMFFGDGQHHRETLRQVANGYSLGTHHHVLRALGRVTEHYALLDKYCSNYSTPQCAKGDRIYYHHGEYNLKELPFGEQLNTPDYMAGFIQGWWIADGHKGEGYHSQNISSTNYEHLDWLIENAQLGGYVATGDRIIGKKVTNLGTAKNPCRCVTVTPGEHVEWEVESIEHKGEAFVYCPSVPDEKAFCLTEGLYTGNCYVNETLDDSMVGIMKGLNNIAFTQQMGGGIGTDFSPIRPPNALVSRTQSPASGPEPFIDSFYAVGTTVASAGARRQAQMGTISDTHPFMPGFVTAKQQAGKWLGFNVSVLVSDAFMAAVQEDAEWLLYFPVPPVYERSADLVSKDFDLDGVTQYVYEAKPAREYWEMITRNTYEYSEPGVIFIDRVNDQNNLQYCETIRCTNPCGEQPLPPNGTCNLGAVNLAFMVKRPFTEDAEFNWDLLAATVQIGVRFLDNVIDVTAYPLPEQEAEEISKRRVGLGFSGLADAMAQLGIRYGSSKAARFAEEVTKVICLKAYETSVELSKERGAFPLFDKDKFFQGFAGHSLPPYLKEEIAENGIRNGVLLTIAPTGTTSILYGNISSGIEPTFLHTMKRKVVQADGSKKEYIAYGFGALMWNELFPNEPLPHYMVTAEDLTVYEHIRIQEVCQRWIDASISKTINLPKETSYEDFQNVYFLAYEAELKGCTTYRPSDVRGSVLSAVDESAPIQEGVKTQKPFERPRILPAQTMKLNWPGLNSAIYLTLGQTEEGPFEVFLSSKDQRYMEWMTATTLMISWLMRAGVPVSKIAQEMKAIQSTEGGWADKKYHKSIVAYLGGALEELASVIPDVPVVAAPAVTLGDTYSLVDTKVSVQQFKPTFTCPQCGGHNPIMKEGCISCGDCSYSKCS